jgi:hypothetical protein
MSLQPRALIALSLVSVSYALVGCQTMGTIYTDTFTNKKTYFVPPPKAREIPIIPTPAAPGDTTPIRPDASSAPSPVPQTPVASPETKVPGLE